MSHSRWPLLLPVSKALLRVVRYNALDAQRQRSFRRFILWIWAGGFARNATCGIIPHRASLRSASHKDYDAPSPQHPPIRAWPSPTTPRLLARRCLMHRVS
jgi:hypothetical protein